MTLLKWLKAKISNSQTQTGADKAPEMSAPEEGYMKLIVGLGNPEAKYDGTRHNVGFAVADEIAKSLGTTFRQNLKKAVVAPAIYNGEKILIAKPQTYMNLSGESVRPLADYYHIPVEDIIIIVDDVNLDIGRIRLRPGGSAGGHNGLKSIEQHLGTAEYARLRVGVGAAKGELINHVLGRFAGEEKDAIEEAEKTAAKAALDFCEYGINAAMNTYNSKNEKG